LNPRDDKHKNPGASGLGGKDSQPVVDLVSGHLEISSTGGIQFELG
jgi:hypothetical protein